MFEKEARGLEELRQSQSFKIPKVLHYGEIENSAYILLEKIESGKKGRGFWKNFAQNLAQMHRNTHSYFGFKEDNYIGSLPQYNQGASATLAGFYIKNRLQPQFKMAEQNGFTFGSLEPLYKAIENQFPHEPPTLIHGDLWSGNYMVGAAGQPVLIDPAVAYVSREMDLAMMRLFGGFPMSVYEYYNEFYPLQPGWEKRVELWQLYYLIVHLNLFGSTYQPSVTRIIDQYS